MDVGESCWGQGQPLRQEQWSAGEWGYGGDRRQGFQVHLTCDFQTGFKVEFIKHFWRVWWGNRSQRGFLRVFAQSLDVYKCVNRDPEMRWSKIRGRTEKRRNHDFPAHCLLPPNLGAECELPLRWTEHSVLSGGHDQWLTAGSISALVLLQRL